MIHFRELRYLPPELKIKKLVLGLDVFKIKKKNKNFVILMTLFIKNKDIWSRM